MPRRILAALVAILAISAANPARLSGEPTTSTTDLLGNPAAAPPNPLALYPRRPNARYEDIEAPPGRAVELGLTRLRLTSWTIEPHDVLADISNPANVADYRSVGLVDGYTRTVTETTGDILHLVVRMKAGLIPAALSCSVTVAADGSVLVPYDRPPPKPPATRSTTTDPPPTDIGLFVPLGGRRGRLYVTCRNTFAHVPIGDDRRAVWGIDV